MNIQFNSANTRTPKNLAQQLIVDLGKNLSVQQRQSLLDIYVALDRAESANHALEQQRLLEAQEQSFWTANETDYSHAEYSEDWMSRTYRHQARAYTKHHSFK
ncbi:hypothetical protein [Acinetobacter brisouii]|uniref:hypothetical protein n=1 Tax=Acinetobacter brisouii TaxID=396323 RepID=UPI0035B3ECB1